LRTAIKIVGHSDSVVTNHHPDVFGVSRQQDFYEAHAAFHERQIIGEGMVNRVLE
jgi:hypothetical protein